MHRFMYEADDKALAMMVENCGPRQVVRSLIELLSKSVNEQCMLVGLNLAIQIHDQNERIRELESKGQGFDPED